MDGYDFNATQDTMYDSEVFSYTLPQLATAFANYGEILKSMKTIGEDFFGNTDGAIYSAKVGGVGSKLKDTWDKKVCNDFDDFQNNFDVWVADANAEGVLLENFHADVKSAYERLVTEGNATGATSSTDSSSLFNQPEIPVTKSEIDEQTGISRDLEIGVTGTTILGMSGISLTPAEWGMIRGLYNSGKRPPSTWSNTYLKAFEAYASSQTDIQNMQTQVHESGHSQGGGYSDAIGDGLGGGLFEQFQQELADKPSDGFDDDNTK